MKKVIVLMFLTLSFVSNAQTQPFEQSVKGKTCLLPVFKKGYKPQFAVSAVSGIQNNPNFDKSAAVLGMEVSLQCPLLCTKKNYIRQQLSIVHQFGKELRSTAVELNPQYRIIAKPNFELGVGPSFGFIVADTNGDEKLPFTYGLGGSIVYHLGDVFFTAETRFALTDKITFTDDASGVVISRNLNNYRTVLKIGYKF